MRFVHLGLLIVSTVLVFGCGSGGTGSDGSPSTIPDPAFVEGKVTSRDGSTTDLGGVQVFDLDTGVAVTTNDIGGFGMQVRSHERVRLRFEDPRASIPHYGEPAGGGHVDVEGDRVDVGPFQVGETCSLEIEMGHDGGILECWVENGPGNHEGEGGLWPGGPHDCIGSIHVEGDGDCFLFEITFRGLEGPEEYEVLLRNAEGDEHSLGTFTVDADGTGTFELEWCSDDPLPFDAQDADELQGVEILVLDSEDNVVLYGKLPGGGPQHGDHLPCPGMSILLPPGATGEPDAMAFAGAMEFDDCSLFDVEVYLRDPAGDLTLVVVSPTGSEESLGKVTISDKGFGDLFLKYCEGDALPLGAETLDDLDGHTLELRDGDGTVVVEGAYPVPSEDCGMPMPPGGGPGHGPGPGSPDWPNIPWPHVPDPGHPPAGGDDE